MKTLEQLEQERAAIPDDDALPITTTRGQLAELHEKRRQLDAHILKVREAQAVLAAPSTNEADERWFNFLTNARADLCAELLTLPTRIRDPKTLGVQQNLQLSIRAIDYGRRVLDDSNYGGLVGSKLGDAMLKAGYEITGADPQTNFVGNLPWFGALPEIEARLQARERRRAQAQGVLDDLLLDDDEREKRESEARALRDAFNLMRVKVAPDGEGLVAYDANREVLALDAMTPLQRKAFEQQDAAFRAEQQQRRRAPVAG